MWMTSTRSFLLIIPRHACCLNVLCNDEKTYVTAFMLKALQVSGMADI